MKWESVVLCILLFLYFVLVVRVYQKANDNRADPKSILNQ